MNLKNGKMRKMMTVSLAATMALGLLAGCTGGKHRTVNRKRCFASVFCMEVPTILIFVSNTQTYMNMTEKM
ncbi:hypothetical protein RE628_08975 [Paenibacillus sp. D2_2]|uniref:hypothetical protein n=1 Tax=Paenibacillus sp. D2_2 TaxID=3073092 RepID=UPI0028155383|nr:hypothetical protein [Paenibacillus sp. D2_2]WMT42465.1 hypothetical protein RE628_08975 [Paenibacillus sp. D2_2]